MSQFDRDRFDDVPRDQSRVGSHRAAPRPGRRWVPVAWAALATGVLLALVARGVARGRRWSRGLAVVTQLILLLLGYSFRQPPTTWAGLVMAAVALTALICLLVPSATRAFVGEDAAG